MLPRRDHIARTVKNKEECAFNTEHIADEIGPDMNFQPGGWKSWCDELFGAAVKIADQSSEGYTINAHYGTCFRKRLDDRHICWSGVRIFGYETSLIQGRDSDSSSSSSNSMEVNHPHQRTPNPEEISFDVASNNKCSTPKRRKHQSR
uniref:SFRICE_035282 n=1 Tax=Spodoptera frugiperda TaxID=7108 RepID=A0A2H1VUP1_SPOFR